ncbi:DUF58 domain-containing protein [Chamaesiphon minutus]|uniref:DUF58 domain-containing protein n=1 Tax=Chamaesiphon minutus (strain ATCC 27169 / PCC 6605) TaxID=1173020 RepID=K9UGA2_CHAP6|nr:DUF58 domain-containing protein [Chamaesiphon minutus]AFY94147.1 hypothetical protein Cha6605_3129 [Chamaesiphon minutus PCC 6605]
MNPFIYRIVRGSYSAQRWLSRRFTPSGLGVLVCFVFSGIVGADTNQSLSYQLFCFLGASLAIAIAASHFQRYRVRATRILPRFGTVGMPLRYRIVFENQTPRRHEGLKFYEALVEPFPELREFSVLNWRTSWQIQRQQWERIMARRKRAIAPSLDLPTLLPQSETEVMGEIIPLQRGLLKFCEIGVTCPDPLGLFNACLALSLPQAVLILPKRYHLPPIQLPGARRHQSGGVALATSVGDAEEFRALREYRPGDPIRKIHWKSWAKVGKPMVKEEQEEFFVRHALILDTFQSAAASELLEEAVAIASSLACEIQTQESLLDMMFVGLESYCFTAGRGLGQTERMLELLASVVPCQDKSFASFLPVIQSRCTLLSGCICILLDWDEERKTLVRYLQSLGIPTLVLVIRGDLGLSMEPTQDAVNSAHSQIRILKLGQIQEGLMQL